LLRVSYDSIPPLQFYARSDPVAALGVAELIAARRVLAAVVGKTLRMPGRWRRSSSPVVSPLGKASRLLWRPAWAGAAVGLRVSGDPRRRCRFERV